MIRQINGKLENLRNGDGMQIPCRLEKMMNKHPESLNLENR